MHLRDLGNSLIVVEHDEDTMRAADCIVDTDPVQENMVDSLLEWALQRNLCRIRSPLQEHISAES